MTKAIRLEHNRELCIRCARQVRRASLARLDTGDTNRVAVALETLAAGVHFADVPHLLAFLQTCDAEGATWFFMHGCATDTLSDCLAVVSGKNRLQWLALLWNTSTWDVCPPLHSRASQLRIAQS
jgi:hypothetical protein